MEPLNSASELYKGFLTQVQQQTGKTADQWKALLQNPAYPQHSDRMRFLQTKHSLSYRLAYLLASHADETRPDYSDPAGLIAAMYQNRRELRPIHDALTELAMLQGEDVTASCGKTMVTFRRKHVFAQIKPATNTRIDFGLALPEMEPAGRLIATGGLAKGDRITYRLPVMALKDVNAELEKWLEQAYLATAPGPV